MKRRASESHQDPSQRALRAGEFLRHAPAKICIRGEVLAVCASVLMPAAASAEVCDKVVGESWRTTDGPVWLLNPSGFPFGLAILAVGLVLVVAAKQWWLGYALSALLVINSVLFVLVDLIPDHEIYRAARFEGCRSYPTDMLGTGLSLLLAVVFAWLGYRVMRRQADRLTLAEPG